MRSEAVTRPREDVATRSYAPDELPTRRRPYVGAVLVPVPPFERASIPETSEARETSPVDTTPLAAFSTPVKVLIEREPKKPAVDDAYADEMLVVEALVNVCS